MIPKHQQTKPKPYRKVKANLWYTYGSIDQLMIDIKNPGMILKDHYTF